MRCIGAASESESARGRDLRFNPADAHTRSARALEHVRSGSLHPDKKCT